MVKGSANPVIANKFIICRMPDDTYKWWFAEGYCSHMELYYDFFETHKVGVAVGGGFYTFLISSALENYSGRLQGYTEYVFHDPKLMLSGTSDTYPMKQSTFWDALRFLENKGGIDVSAMLKGFEFADINEYKGI
jgi:hypothetical protein